MGRSLENKCKQCRRAGEKLYLKGERCNTSKCTILRRNYPPGAHGPKGNPRLTEYGSQLAEKQKARRTYRIMEKQFRRYYEEAKVADGNTEELMAKSLELRLDNIVYRAGFAPSRDSARQMISHGHLEVNGRRLNIPSYSMREKDVITLRKSSHEKGIAQDLKPRMEQTQVPAWIEADPTQLKITLNRFPLTEDIQTGLSMNTIVEYYSR